MENIRAARIENGRVVDLWMVPELDCYGELYTLVAAPDDVQIGATYASGVFTNAPPPPLTRKQQIAVIDKQRDTAIDGGLTFNGVKYHADPMFQSQIQAFILAFNAGILPPAATVTVRRKDNVNALLSQVEIVQLAGALMQHVQAIYAQSWAAKDAL